MSNTNFVALIIGNLGNSGELSLKSMLELNPNRLCYLSDEVGQKWVNSVVKRYKLNRKLLCKHIIKQNIYNELKINNQINKHREFGQESFIRLTPLKWLLISQTLNKHKREKFVVFSDLDIIWFSLPNFNKIKRNTIYIQNDFRPKSNKPYYCTGIMIWPQTSQVRHEVKNLYAFQKLLISSGKLIPDEPAFNLYINQKSFKSKVTALNKGEYVIGHKTRKILKEKNKSLHKIHAYHANYFTGDKQKTIAMKSILSKKRKTAYWIFGLVAIYGIKISNKIILNLNNLVDKVRY
jgi:hypothetical protein